MYVTFIYYSFWGGKNVSTNSGELRVDNDLTQKALAKLLNVSRQTYSNYERGYSDTPAWAFVILAKHYNTSVDYLIGITDVKEPYPYSKAWTAQGKTCTQPIPIT